MNVKFINPFVEAASEVIRIETDVNLTRGELTLEKTPYLTDDITVILALVGMVNGNVLYSLNFQTAIALSSRMLGENLEEFDNLAQSGIAELANVITGRASIKLSAAGYESTISPPTLVVGKGITISTLDRPRLIVPFQSEYGQITIHLALREGSTNFVSAAHLQVPHQPDVK